VSSQGPSRKPSHKCFLTENIIASTTNPTTDNHSRQANSNFDTDRTWGILKRELTSDAICYKVDGSSISAIGTHQICTTRPRQKRTFGKWERDSKSRTQNAGDDNLIMRKAHAKEKHAQVQQQSCCSRGKVSFSWSPIGWMVRGFERGGSTEWVLAIWQPYLNTDPVCVCACAGGSERERECEGEGQCFYAAADVAALWENLTRSLLSNLGSFIDFPSIFLNI